MPPSKPLRQTVKGDSSKRVTVPLPQSLDVLESTAKKCFGQDGAKLKMYHRGEQHIQHHQHFKNVEHNDVVVVRKEDIEPRAAFPRDMKTTAQSSFVKHPIEQRRAPPPAKSPSPDMRPPAFQGRSCYASDYPGHAPSLPEKKAPSVWEPGGVPFSARSAYADNFPWHPTQPRLPDRRPDRVGAMTPPPFHGQSSYRNDYIKHETPRPRTASGTKIKEPLMSVPFSGNTTYGNDFKKHPHAQSKRIGPFRQDSGPSPKFQGTSEYNNQYLKKNLPQPSILHLEPEERRRGSTM